MREYIKMSKTDQHGWSLVDKWIQLILILCAGISPDFVEPKWRFEPPSSITSRDLFRSVKNGVAPVSISLGWKFANTLVTFFSPWIYFNCPDLSSVIGYTSVVLICHSCIKKMFQWRTRTMKTFSRKLKCSNEELEQWNLLFYRYIFNGLIKYLLFQKYDWTKFKFSINWKLAIQSFYMQDTNYLHHGSVSDGAGGGGAGTLSFCYCDSHSCNFDTMLVIIVEILAKTKKILYHLSTRLIIVHHGGILSGNNFLATFLLKKEHDNFTVYFEMFSLFF